MRITSLIATTVAAALIQAAVPAGLAAQAKYAVRVPGGLSFSEIRGYEEWQVISVSESNGMLAAILGNPAMISAFKSGIPANGKPFPDGAKMAKVHWYATKLTTFPGATVPGAQHDVDVMVKDSKRFADSGGWGYAYFVHDTTNGTFRPATTSDTPPQANDAKCGFACHTVVKSRDYVFTDFHSR